MDTIIFNNIYNTSIKPLFNNCIIKMDVIHKKLFSRMRKLSFKDIFYTECIVNGFKKSYDIAIGENKLNNIYNVSKKSILAKRKKIDSSYISQVIECVINDIYKKDNEYRYLAIDGTLIYVPILSDDKNVKICNNGSCNIILINSIFELEKKIPINNEICKHRDERKALNEQLKYLKCNDVLILDRGYYSKQLLFSIKENNLNAIFRLSKGLDLVKQLKKSHKDEIFINVKVKNITIPLRILSYKLNEGKGNENYYLASTLIDNKSIDFYKEKYHKRWAIETHFKHAKYNMSLINIKSKTFNGIKKDILANQFVSIISGYFEYLLADYIQKPKDKYKINTNNCLNLTSKLFPLLFYSKNENYLIEQINPIFNIIATTLVCIQINRHYKRIRKRPISKWRISGGTSNRPRTKGCKRKTTKKQITKDDPV
jgi:DDE family transposase